MPIDSQGFLFMYIKGVHATYGYSSIGKTAFPGRRDDSANRQNPAGPGTLSEEEQRRVEELKNRDREVKNHEEAHRRAAGSLAGPPKYVYRTGPDGRRYAVEGSLSIDTSEEATPEQTAAKAAQVRRAALAPKNPSARDRQVARDVSRMEAEARAEIARKRFESMKAYRQNDLLAQGASSPENEYAIPPRKEGGSPSVSPAATAPRFSTLDRSASPLDLLA
jgi:hypothetical protein